MSPARRADARHGAPRGAAQEALRAAAVPEALRHQPESARAAGQGAAGLRPRQGNPAGARNPLPSRARQLRDARRRAGRRQDRDRRRAGAADRVRAGHRAGAAARLPGRQPADEHDGRRHDAARDVRGPHPERHPRAEGAAEPHSVRRRSAHDGRRRLGARRAVGCRQRVQVGARARRDPDGRRHDAQRVQGIHPGRRGARAAVPLRHRAASRRSRRPGGSSTTCGRASSATTRSACSTRRSRRRWRCRRATCGTCTCRTRSSAGSTPPRCGPRSIAAGRSRRKTSSRSISHAAQIPEDMVFRDVTDRFKDIEARLQKRVDRPAECRRAPSRNGWC